MCSIPQPMLQSCDTGQRKLFFNSCQLIITWMSNTKFYTDNIKVCHFASANIKGWTYVRTHSVRTIFSEAKFLGSIDYHIFLPMVLRCSRAPPSASQGSERKGNAQLCLYLCGLYLCLILSPSEAALTFMIQIFFSGFYTCAQLFEGRLALNLELNLRRVYFSWVQKYFLG